MANELEPILESINRQADEQRSAIDTAYGEQQRRLDLQAAEIEQQRQATLGYARLMERKEQRKSDLPYSQPLNTGLAENIRKVEDWRTRSLGQLSQAKQELVAAKAKAYQSLDKSVLKAKEDTTKEYERIQAINAQITAINKASEDAVKAQQAALDNLSSYRVGMDSYDIAKAIKDGKLADVQRAGFTEDDIAKAQVTIKQSEALNDALKQLEKYTINGKTYDLVTAIRDGHIDDIRLAGFDSMDVVDAQIKAADKGIESYTKYVLAPYEAAGGGYYLVRALNEGVDASVLRMAGYTQEQIDEAKKQLKVVIDKMPSNFTTPKVPTITAITAGVSPIDTTKLIVLPPGFIGAPAPGQIRYEDLTPAQLAEYKKQMISSTPVSLTEFANAYWFSKDWGELGGDFNNVMAGNTAILTDLGGLPFKTKQQKQGYDEALELQSKLLETEKAYKEKYGAGSLIQTNVATVTGLVTGGVPETLIQPGGSPSKLTLDDYITTGIAAAAFVIPAAKGIYQGIKAPAVARAALEAAEFTDDIAAAVGRGDYGIGKSTVTDITGGYERFGIELAPMDESKIIAAIKAADYSEDIAAAVGRGDYGLTGQPLGDTGGYGRFGIELTPAETIIMGGNEFYIPTIRAVEPTLKPLGGGGIGAGRTNQPTVAEIVMQKSYTPISVFTKKGEYVTSNIGELGGLTDTPNAFRIMTPKAVLGGDEYVISAKNLLSGIAETSPEINGMRYKISKNIVIPKTQLSKLFTVTAGGTLVPINTAAPMPGKMDAEELPDLEPVTSTYIADSDVMVIQSYPKQVQLAIIAYAKALNKGMSEIGAIASTQIIIANLIKTGDLSSTTIKSINDLDLSPTQYNLVKSIVNLATKAVIANQVQNLVSTRTNTAVNTNVATQTATKTQTAIQTKTATKVLTDIATPTKTIELSDNSYRESEPYRQQQEDYTNKPYEERTPYINNETKTTMIRNKPPIRFPLPDSNDEGTVLSGISEQPIITWKQGFVYWSIYPPYKSSNDVKCTRVPPNSAKIVSGAGSAYKTIQSLGGDASVILNIDLGAFDIQISNPSSKAGKRGAIKYSRDKYGYTSNKITVKGVKA